MRIEVVHRSHSVGSHRNNLLYEGEKENGHYAFHLKYLKKSSLGQDK